MKNLPPGLTLIPGVLDPVSAHEQFAALLTETPWETHSFTIFGRTMPMPRRIAMYGPHGYRYSGITHPPRPLSPRLQSLSDRLTEATGMAFNSVLLNLYRDGRDSMGWHTDDDYDHGGQPVIASLSLGAIRRFRLRPRGGGPGVGLDLDAGSLLLIAGTSRTDWQHALPRTARAVGPRINLTWRHMTGA